MPKTSLGGGTSAAGTILAITTYAPVGADDKAISSTTFAAYDATHLTVSFVAPPSGAVLINLQASMYVGTGNLGFWALLDHVSHAMYGNIANYIQIGGGACASDASIYIKGLIPGQTYQMDWAGAIRTGGSTDTMNISANNNITPGTNSHQPATMIVYSAI